MNDKKIYILMGGSGSGKTTLGNYLKEIGIPEMVSHTTRAMREGKGEIDGVTYYFINKEEFHSIEKIEWTEYPEESGNFYCLSKKEVDTKLAQYGKVFAITDIKGVEPLRAQYPNQVEVIYIFIPLEIMEKRMRKRGDSENAIQERLRQARETNELLNYFCADYVIENNDLEESMKRIKEIVSLPMDKKEIERKFLINNISDLEKLPKKEISQGYISFEPEQRIRKEDNLYYLTSKSEGDLIREEKEELISQEAFDYYSTFVLHNFIEKTRYLKLIGNQVAEIDVYHNELEGLKVVEVEFISENEANQFVIPDWFGEEVTNDKGYKNKNLAKNGRPLNEKVESRC